MKDKLEKFERYLKRQDFNGSSAYLKKNILIYYKELFKKELFKKELEEMTSREINEEQKKDKYLYGFMVFLLFVVGFLVWTGLFGLPCWASYLGEKLGGFT